MIIDDDHPVETDGSQYIDLGNILRISWQYRVPVILITFMFAAILIATSFLFDKIYRAETVLADASPQKSLAGNLGGGVLGELAGIASLSGNDNQVEVAIATIKSRSFVTSFIRESKLMPFLFVDQWDAEKNAWKESDPANIPTEWDAYELFDEDILQVFTDPATGIVTLSIEWADPVLAAQWANAMIGRLNKLMQTQAIERSQINITFLKSKLEAEQVADLRLSIAKLVAQEMQANTLAKSREEFVFRVIDPAVPPQRHERPRRALFGFFGILLGLIASSFFVFFRHQSKPDAPLTAAD